MAIKKTIPAFFSFDLENDFGLNGSIGGLHKLISEIIKAGEEGKSFEEICNMFYVMMKEYEEIIVEFITMHVNDIAKLDPKKLKSKGFDIGADIVQLFKERKTRWRLFRNT